MAGIWRVLRDTLQSRCPAGRPERLRLKKLKKEEAVALHLKLSCKIFKTIYVVCILQLQHLASSFPCKIANFEWYVGSCNITSSTQFNHQRITSRFTTRHKSIKALTWNGTYYGAAVRCKKLLTPILSATKMPSLERLGLKKLKKEEESVTQELPTSRLYFYAAARVGRISASNSLQHVA
jgi:hypothetical protein